MLCFPGAGSRSIVFGAVNPLPLAGDTVVVDVLGRSNQVASDLIEILPLTGGATSYGHMQYRYPTNHAFPSFRYSNAMATEEEWSFRLTYSLTADPINVVIDVLRFGVQGKVCVCALMRACAFRKKKVYRI